MTGAIRVRSARWVATENGLCHFHWHDTGEAGIDEAVGDLGWLLLQR